MTEKPSLTPPGRTIPSRVFREVSSQFPRGFDRGGPCRLSVVTLETEGVPACQWLYIGWACAPSTGHSLCASALRARYKGDLGGCEKKEARLSPTYNATARRVLSTRAASYTLVGSSGTENPSVTLGNQTVRYRGGNCKKRPGTGCRGAAPPSLAGCGRLGWP